MRQAILWRYVLDMEAGVILRDRHVRQREGLLVQLIVGEREGWGEIAPLPGFSLETLSEAQQAAENWLSHWCHSEMQSESALPSVAFGLSCALMELAGTLPVATHWRTAALCTGDPDALFARLQQLPHGTAKMKVGWYEAVRDGMVASLLLEALPDLHLRLDANRRWTPEKARQFARHLAPELRCRIDFLEEPCQRREDSRQFAAETGIAIAWDESARATDFQLQAEPGVAAIVIKPTLTGSISRVSQQVAQVQALGMKAVISSSIESSLGLTQLAGLAQSLTPDVVPGLDTLDLLQQQLVRRWPTSPLPLLDTQDLVCVWRR